MTREELPRRNSRWAAALMIAGFCCISLFALWRISPFGRGTSRVQEELDRLQLLGIPTDAADLRSGKSVRDSQNAAVVYGKAMKLYFAVPSADRSAIASDFSFIGPVGPPGTPPPDDKTVRTALNRFDPIFRLMEAGAATPKMDAKRRWEDGPRLIFADYSYGSSIAKAMILKAAFDESDGKPIDALKLIDAVAGMAHHFGQEPILLGLFVKAHMLRMCQYPLREILKSHGTDTRVLDATRKVLEDFGPPADIHAAIGGEIVTLRVAAETMKSGDLRDLMRVSSPPGSSQTSSALRYSSYRIVRQAYEAQALEAWREIADRLPEDPSDFLSICSAFKKEASKVSSRKDWQYDLYRALFYGLASTGESIARSETSRRLMLSVIDSLEYAVAHLRYPDQLVSRGSTSIDPFTGKPFTYVRYSSSFMIYSFGPNGEDDAGDPVGASWTRLPTDDIPYTYP